MNQTVVGIFDSAEEAQQAARQLAAAGFTKDYVDVASSSAYRNASGTATTSAATTSSSASDDDSIGGFFRNLFGGDDDENARRYSHVARQSSSLVTVHCHSAENARQAAEILDQAGAIDVEERAAQTGYALGNNLQASGTASTQGAVSAQVIEENLQVGKRVEQTGGARLRSRIVERPVEAHVRLREEHVTVERTPVNRPATEADFAAFKEGQVEITESAERAVVGKEARVVEEVTLGKEVTEREETIRDTVRKTEVDIERLDNTTGTGTTGDTNRS
ncbi:YsnF/AvaK domain-containing protein [Hymenobacter weizhouensis]|uniref:YsnF/AvaK domain-containing protein n=1 Tax=Hymenobacter sp. YIM 151500-1 TaxID=2987689 RepID=UPI0022275A7D|nr:YsnF/AvaK domain-containing protein [Hymenobacter sp. YIM 151500-1]UYZ63158.1 YsnF/AvaK domain-containing protein [Hymenobacter sp. YIM 151500-1]